MTRVLNLVDKFCKLAVGSSSSSGGLLVNVPMLVRACFSKPRSISSVPSISIPGQPSQDLVDYYIYTDKSALRITPLAPEFSPLNSGSIRISKVGSVLLQFAHSVGGRKYDWDKQQIFALSATELGSLLSLSPNESCEFFHDPLMGKGILLLHGYNCHQYWYVHSGAGQISKVLHVEPLQDPPGCFFSLKVSNKIAQIEEQFNIPITKAEFTVMRSSFNFILPYIMGWHAFANSINIGEQARVTSG